MFAYFRAPLPWTELGRRTIVDTFEDGCPGLAAQLAFYFVLAVFPALLFLVSLVSYLPVQPALAPVLARLHGLVPAEVAAFVLAALIVVLGGADLGAWLAARVGAGDLFARVWAVVQWPVAIALVVVAVDVVYYFAPNADTEWTWVTPGAVLATVLWLVTSAGFRFYVRNVSDYTAVYGAIGSVIVLLLWFYLSGFALLIGAELNAEIDKALPSPDEGAQGPGRKKKIGPAAEKARDAFSASTTLPVPTRRSE